MLNPPKYFSPSYESHNVFLQRIAVLDLPKKPWTELFATLAEKLACSDVLLCRYEFWAKTRQSLSDERIPRNRKTRDMPFSSLGYNYLLLEYILYSMEQKTSEAVQVLKAKPMLLRTSIPNELAFSQLRCAKVAIFSSSDLTRSTDDGIIEHPHRNRKFSFSKMSFPSLMIFRRVCRDFSQSLEPRSSLLKEAFSHPRS